VINVKGTIASNFRYYYEDTIYVVI